MSTTSSGLTDLVLTRDGDVAVVTLNRPEKRNALRAGTFGDLLSAFTDLLGDPGVRAIVLTGAGDRAFSAGADLSEPPIGQDVGPMLERVQTMLNTIEEAGTPVIAAMNGDAFGGGLEIALACHFRVMSRGARLGLTESNLGIMPAAGGTQRLTRLIGPARALELMIFGKRVEAEEAYHLGIVQRLSEPGRTLEDGLALARSIARRAPIAVRGIVHTVMTSLNRGSIAEGLRLERECFAKCAQSSDAVEGVAAFFAKRDANFEGK
jgi:enoyl-CoA hydratase/carnithine racemase